MNVAMGIGGTLLSKMLAAKTWTIVNEDTLKEVQGQFPHDGLTYDVGSNYAEIQTLNRQNPVLQYLNGETDKLQLQARFFRRDMLDEAPSKKMDTLVEWTRRDQRLGRPPILRFWVGDGTQFVMRVVLVGIAGITYSTPHFFGGMREVKFTLNFKRFTPFSLNDQQITDTRYHRTKESEYYELIAAAEYGNPLLGDIIRNLKEQIGKAILKPGDVVKLPAIEGVRTQKVTPRSIILQGAYGRKETAQKALRNEYFAARSVARPMYFLEPPAQLGDTPAVEALLLSTEDLDPITTEDDDNLVVPVL